MPMIIIALYVMPNLNYPNIIVLADRLFYGRVIHND